MINKTQIPEIIEYYVRHAKTEKIKEHKQQYIKHLEEIQKYIEENLKEIK